MTGRLPHDGRMTFIRSNVATFCLLPNRQTGPYTHIHVMHTYTAAAGEPLPQDIVDKIEASTLQGRLEQSNSCKLHTTTIGSRKPLLDCRR